MGVTRDTSADDAAALMRRPVEGENDRPTTLSGTEAAAIRRKLRVAYERLERAETQIKIRFVKDLVRDARIAIGVALTILPEASRQ